MDTETERFARRMRAMRNGRSYAEQKLMETKQTRASDAELKAQRERLRQIQQRDAMIRRAIKPGRAR